MPATPARRKSPARKARYRRENGTAWFRRADDCWYFTDETGKAIRIRYESGEPIRGENNSKDANNELGRIRNLMKAGEATGEHTIQRVLDDYLEYFESLVVLKQRSESTLDGYLKVFTIFSDEFGALQVSELEDKHVWDVAKKYKWHPRTSRQYIICLKTAIKYAVKRHRVTGVKFNPIDGLTVKVPPPENEGFTPEDEAAIYSVTNPAFARFIRFGILTGLRTTGELAQLKTDDVLIQGDVIRIQVYSKKTNTHRTFKLQPEAAEMVRELLKDAKRGQALLRNERGRAWTQPAIGSNWNRIRKRLKWDKDPVKKHLRPYSSRHTLAQRMIIAGAAVSMVAKILGNSEQVCHYHYSRYWDRQDGNPLDEAIDRLGEYQAALAARKAK